MGKKPPEAAETVYSSVSAGRSAGADEHLPIRLSAVSMIQTGGTRGNVASMRAGLFPIPSGVTHQESSAQPQVRLNDPPGEVELHLMA